MTKKTRKTGARTPNARKTASHPPAEATTTRTPEAKSARTPAEREGSGRDAVVAWALAALEGGAPARTLRPALDQRPHPLWARFGLDATERRVVELAWAAERSLAVAEAARARGGLTVERVRDLVGGDVDAALSPRRALRRHALVAVGAGGLPAATDVVRLGPGLAARLDGAADPEGLWPGTVRVVPGARGDVPARLALVVEELDAAAPALWTLDGCPRREAHELAAGLARRLGRGVLVVDGELLAAAPDPMLLLACARREADCEGDALVVCAAAALGERWRAALAPAAGVAPLVVLADAERTRDPVAAAPFAVRRLTLHAAPPAVVAAAAVAATTAAAPEEKAAPVDDGLEQVRQQAIRDAERALGIYRAPPPPPRPPLRPIAPPAAATPPAPAAPPTAKPATPAPISAPAATQTPPPTAATPPAATATPAASAAAAQSFVPKKRSAKGALYFGGEYTTPPAPAAPPASAAPPAPADTPPAASPAQAETPAPGATPATAASPADADGAPLPLAPDASLDELARAALTSPSAAQRIELIGRIRTVKSAAVVAALRANAASAHPGVRAAAEAAMAALFGPNWNVVRPVPKPVQPPPSDDKDRGPPGGW